MSLQNDPFEKIKSKNMIIIGKTNMDEFAMGSTSRTSYFGSPLNPWNKERISGGSSIDKKLRCFLIRVA
mgnify:CR=1 FL=1